MKGVGTYPPCQRRCAATLRVRQVERSWHLPALPTPLRGYPTGQASRKELALTRLANAAARLPYGSGKSKGVGTYPPCQRRCAATLRVRQVERSWHLPALPTPLRGYPTGQASRKELDYMVKKQGIYDACKAKVL